MPLDPDDLPLLYEIYECPTPGVTEIVVSPGSGATAFPTYISPATSVQQRLGRAIDYVNTNESYVTRVTEVITEYRGFATDPSDIDRDGYRFRAKANLKALRKILFPFIGIIMDSNSGSNQVDWG